MPLILFSKVNNFTSLFLSLCIFLLYSYKFNDFSISECTTPWNTHESDKEYIEFLESEAWNFDTRITELEAETKTLENSNKILVGEVDALKTENKKLLDYISLLETNASEKKEDQI